MRKINNKTITILLIIALYAISSLIFLTKLGNIYFRIINPLFWILLSIICHFFFKNEYVHKKYKKDILLTTIIVIFIFFILYYSSGILFGFQKTPYSKAFKGILLNVWNYGIFLIFREYIRQILINRTGKNKKLIVLITILFIILDVSRNVTIQQFSSSFLIFQYTSIVLLPTIAKHMLLTYLTYTSNFLPSIIYAFVMETFSFIVPFMPNIDWFINGIINLVLPFVVFITTYRIIERREDKKQFKKNYKRDILYLPLLILVIMLAILVSGLFKYQLIAVASGSMVPVFNRGDAVLIKQLESSEIKNLKVGDIIVFIKDKKTVMHRIIEKEEIKEGTFVYKTKGDNNNGPDKGVVEEGKIIGKYVFGIKYIGYPSVLLQENVF